VLFGFLQRLAHTKNLRFINVGVAPTRGEQLAPTQASERLGYRGGVNRPALKFVNQIVHLIIGRYHDLV